MRSFEDATGRRWDVVLGRESWGGFFAIFVPRGTEAEGDDRRVRQARIDASDGAEAGRMLKGMERKRLLELLDESTPKELG